jgi:hypothetical protein
VDNTSVHPPRYTIVDEGIDPHLKTRLYRVRQHYPDGTYADYCPLTSYAAAALMVAELEQDGQVSEHTDLLLALGAL